MALDIHKTARQIESMASSLQASVNSRQYRLRAALAALERPLDRSDPGPLTADILRHRIDAGERRKVTWLVAEPPWPDGDEPSLSERVAPTEPPVDYAALATDGSQVDVDRHGPAHLFLINVGGAEIRYGSSPGARLFSEPFLFSQPEQLVMRDPGGGTREQPIDGPVLGIKRTVMECEALERELRQIPTGLPALALLDGSLILWELSGERYPDFVRTQLLDEGFLPALDRLYEQRTERPLAFASYISRPRGTEVVNILRVARCPHDGLETEGCDHFCGRGGQGRRECDEVALGLMDRDLFEAVLAPGERSSVFASQSSIVMRHYGRHRIRFFYVNTGEEIARVEMPEWVAEDPDAVDLLHAGVLDQCRKGQGYPIALQEAHERAVVTMTDRRYFWSLVQSSLDGRGLSSVGTLKARSKRVRGV